MTTNIINNVINSSSYIEYINREKQRRKIDNQFLDTDDKEVIAFTRTKAENEIVVFINLSENQKEIK